MSRGLCHNLARPICEPQGCDLRHCHRINSAYGECYRWTTTFLMISQWFHTILVGGNLWLQATSVSRHLTLGRRSSMIHTHLCGHPAEAKELHVYGLAIGDTGYAILQGHGATINDRVCGIAVFEVVPSKASPCHLAESLTSNTAFSA